MPKLDLAKVPVKSGTIYPAPYDAEVAGRSSLRLGDAGGLTQFGVNIVILAPGAKSSLRHWHLQAPCVIITNSSSCKCQCRSDDFAPGARITILTPNCVSPPASPNRKLDRPATSAS